MKRKLFDDFITTGKVNSKILVNVLFYSGLIVIICFGVLEGKYLAETYKIWTTVQKGNMYTGAEVNNYVLNIFGFLIVVIVSIVIWKVLCELIYFILEALKVYINRNKMK